MLYRENRFSFFATATSWKHMAMTPRGILSSNCRYFILMFYHQQHQHHAEKSKQETTSKKLKTTEKFSSFYSSSSAHVPLGALRSGNLIKWATEEKEFFASIIHFDARDKNSISCSASVWLLRYFSLGRPSARCLMRLLQITSFAFLKWVYNINFGTCWRIIWVPSFFKNVK